MHVKASTLDVVNVPNAKYLAHLPHQSPKIIFIRYSKCHNFYNIWTVSFYICHCTDKNGILNNIFLFPSLSPLSSVYYFLSSLTSVLSHRFSSLSRLSSPIVIADPSSPSVIADLSPVAFCIVIVDLSGHRHRHHRSESTWASTLRWDRCVRHDRGHRRWGEVRSWSWVAGASGFELIGVFSGFGLS